MSRNLPPLNQQSINASSSQLSQLRQGLKLVGKTLISTVQWTTQFTKIQNKHQQQLKIKQKQIQKLNQKLKNSKLKQKILKGLNNFTQKVCQLCLQQKNAENFVLMCKCKHSFCYSCLNIYAISKIQDMQRVVCPQKNCSFQMNLSSSVYKYLPQIIKLKYLQYQLQNKSKKVQIKGKCLRCFQKQHDGQCRVSFKPNNIEQSFTYRKCKNCETQAQMTQGKKMIICHKCKQSFCYICGDQWKNNEDHTCKDKTKVNQLEIKYKSGQNSVNCNCCQGFCQEEGCCCDICNICQECCPGIKCNCFRNCSQCFQSCCYCDKCNLQVFCGNIFLFPIRIIVSIFVLLFYVLIFFPMLLMLLVWIFGGLTFGAICITCQLLQQQFQGGMKIIGILLLPFLIIIAMFIGLKQTSKGVSHIFDDYFSLYSEGLCSMWVSCGPKQCCD